MRFADRQDAGRRLASLLGHLVSIVLSIVPTIGVVGIPSGSDDAVVVLGLPRGGVPVALEIALALVGAARRDRRAQAGRALPARAGDGRDRRGRRPGRRRSCRQVRRRDRTRRSRRSRHASAPSWRGGRSSSGATPRRSPSRGGQRSSSTTGSPPGRRHESRAGSSAARGASRLVLAVPVAPERWTRELQGEADEFVCVSAPRWYRSVGEWYRDFSQTTDDEVIRCLEQAAR